jgi:glutamate/tyrosine decarboxylase-like PLP-dependent enzyme
VHQILADDLAGLPAILDDTRRLAGSVLDRVDTRPVSGHPATSLASLPEHGVGAREALARFMQRWEPAFSATAGPRYLGFVTGGATPASIAGDWLTTVLDQNVAAGHESAASDLERETVRWLGELFGLRDVHSGAFVSGATMSNVVGLAIAREWLGEQRGISVAHSGVAALGRVEVLSGTPHSSAYKALSMLGLGRDSVRSVPALAGREAVDVGKLEEALAALEGRPAIVIANAGTVNTVDFDDLRGIAALKTKYPFWLHVDGAFGTFAALSPRYAHLVDGLDEADSLCVDLHKWLNVPYDAAVQFSRRPDLQVRVFQNSAPYLGIPSDNPDFVHLTPESSRRLRALTAWFTLTAYGRDGHRDIVERTIASAQRLGELIDESDSARLIGPVRLNVVCFAPAGAPSAQRVDEICRTIAADGETFVTPTIHNGQPGLRAAFSNWRTTDTDVDRVFAAITKAAA